jgi:hypothetical protein
MKRFMMVAFALAAAGAGVSCHPAAGGQPTQREFHMGFTPFPYDMTVQAIQDVEKFVRANGDLLTAHLEGVPWAEAAATAPFHPKMLEDWARHKRAVPEKGKMYLAVTPINNDRSDLAAYRSEREGMPMPEAFAGKTFDDPNVAEAYLRYCRRAVEYFRPDYLAIGIEVNELYHKAPRKFPAYARLHRQVYKALKKDHPELPIFATYTLHNLLNTGWADRKAMLAACQELMEYNDFVAISYYPFMANLSGQNDQCLRWLSREFDRFGKPYAFCEMGQPAETVSFDGGKITIPSSPALQQRVLSGVLDFATSRRTEFVVWFVPRDYDAMWEKIRNTAPDFFKVWRDCGLQDGQGKPRPACQLWQRVLALPYRPPARK